MQGHPEMTPETVQAVVREDDGTYTSHLKQRQVQELPRIYSADNHNGPEIFRAILLWACGVETQN